LLYENNLQLKEFTNNIWRVYFQILYDLVTVEKKSVLDDITIGLYLEKHPKLKSKYEKYNGYETIINATTYVKTENLDGYISELRKWNAVLLLGKNGFAINERISDFCDMTAEEIYDEYEALLNHTFVNVDQDIKVYDICDGIYDLIDKLDEGFAVGLPYYNMPMISVETGGQYLGSITLVGGLSNVGKSTWARTAVIPSIIDKKEKIVIMVNEDGLEKWQRELLVFICNNILKYDIQKHIVRDGNYTDEVKQKLIESAKWLEEQTKNNIITIIPFNSYKTSKAIKVIKKFSSLGVKYFMLDTFKMDTGRVSNQAWLEMQQAMVDINDVVKPESKNLHILITFQLEKGSAKQRFYTQSNIGMAKNIVDVASTCLMIRDLFDDEYTDGKRPLKVYKLDGKNKSTKIPVKLKREKHYQIIFIVKNREGSANQYQIVLEHDLSRNIVKEIGITNVPLDF